MNFTTLTFEIKDQIAHLNLHRPEAGNGLNGTMCAELKQVAIECADRPDVRAVLFTGSGKYFCVGGDLKSFHAEGEALPLRVRSITTDLHAAVSRLARLSAPIITAVQGAAAGAGLSFVCLSDLVLAGESSKFSMAYTTAALTPDGGASYFLPKIIGLRRAMEMTLTPKVLTAAEALDYGLVTRVVKDSELVENARALAAQIAQGPTLAYRRAKHLLNHSYAESLETHLEFESQSISESAKTLDSKEGIAAFLSKRPPQFQGR